MVAPPVAREPEGSGSADRRLLHRRIRLVRRHLGPGPYLHFGCDRGALLALLAAHGSASGFVADAALAEIARGAAPGCPVHTNPDAIPVGVFRGVLTTGLADDAALAVWRRVLVRSGRVLMIAAAGGDDGDGGGVGGGWGGGDIAEDRLAAVGFGLRWTGRERRWSGAAVAVLEAVPGPGSSESDPPTG